MKYRSVFFDFDYTLGDATVGIVTSFRYAFHKLGLPEPAELAIKKTVGLSLEESFLRLTGIGDAGLAERFRQLFKDKADEVMAAGTVLFDDTVTILEYLKKHQIKTGIVTTKYRYRIGEILKNNDAGRLVDTIVGGEDVTKVKPDPEGLLLAAKSLGTSLEDTLYVGDSEVDAAAALAARVDFCAVLTGTTGRESFEKYPYILIADNLTILLEYLKSRGQQ